MNCGTWLLDTIQEGKAIDKKNKAEGGPPIYICPICGTENRTFVKYCSTCDTYPEKLRKQKVNLLPFFIGGFIILLFGYFAIKSATAMLLIFVMLAFVALVALIVGLINPKAVVRWSAEEKRTRGRAAMIYGFSTIFFLVVFAVACVVTYPSSSRNTASNSTPSVSTTKSDVKSSLPAAHPTLPSAIRITAEVLTDEYSANQLAADEKYKGKILDVRGTVSDIDKTMFGTPYVTFETSNLIEGTMCNFTTNDTPLLAQISKGDIVTIQGTCSGKSGPEVMINNCSIVSN